LWFWDLNSGPHDCWLGAPPLEPPTCPENTRFDVVVTERTERGVSEREDQKAKRAYITEILNARLVKLAFIL
jgi:hypothetical protein